jgi:hypothetical protein
MSLNVFLSPLLIFLCLPAVAAEKKNIDLCWCLRQDCRTEIPLAPPPVPADSPDLQNQINILLCHQSELYGQGTAAVKEKRPAPFTEIRSNHAALEQKINRLKGQMKIRLPWLKGDFLERPQAAAAGTDLEVLGKKIELTTTPVATLPAPKVIPTEAPVEGLSPVEKEQIKRAIVNRSSDYEREDKDTLFDIITKTYIRAVYPSIF